jgi:hypothetical protein
MSYGKVLAFSVLTIALLSSATLGPAQVSIGIGVEPVCPYGYYGPDWFVGGVFFGAGPWFRGPHGFYGHVDNRFDPRNGYHGPLPERGAERFNHFHGNEARDGRGNVGNAGHDAGREHALPGYRGGGSRRR